MRPDNSYRHSHTSNPIIRSLLLLKGAISLSQYISMFNYFSLID